MIKKIKSRLSQSMHNIQPNSMFDKFNTIYKNNSWGDPESVSGTGSNMLQTAVIRNELPNIIKTLDIQSMLDIPCGDFNWMSTVNLEIDYIGADIVSDIIEKNNKKYSNDKRKFVSLDVTKDDLPKVDIIFCRDCLVHFSFNDINKAIKNIKRSESKYLLTTSFTRPAENVDIETGSWRPLNLQFPPSSLSEPIMLINENCNENNGIYSDKSLGLWKIDDLDL
jgi:hypothetical protein